MVRFSDLAKKEVNREKKPKTFSADDIMNLKVPSLHSHEWYQRACRYLEYALGQVRDEKNIGETFSTVIEKGERIIKEIVGVHSQGYLSQDLLIQSLHMETADSFLITNPVNVTIYAIMMGATLALPREKLMELGLAALLHDVGKIRVPEEILYKEKALSEKEWSVLRNYPHESFNVLCGLGHAYSYLPQTAFQVCETLDGSGYPRGLKGEEIHPYAQIIGLLDVFEAITHNRPYRRKFCHFVGIKEIIRTKKNAFHGDLLKAFLQTFSLFPLHSHVKLNSGAVGKVVQTYRDQPLRPRVEIVLDAQKKAVSFPRTVDLRDQALLHVVDTVAEENIQG